MYKIKKRIEISAAHFLKLSAPTKCSNLHGHNWVITIYLKAEKLNADGMICDFDLIEKILLDKFDHKVLNEVVDFNPTAENLAKHICDMFKPHYCYKVKVQESENNVATYEV